MPERYPSAVGRVLLTLVLLALSASVPAAASAAAASEYGDLVSLFDEFREFQESVPATGIADYTPPAVRERYLGLTGFRQRLAAIWCEQK